MVEVVSLAVEAARIRAAVDNVLQDETFRRAPVMSRLLRYLADRTLAGITVKSYTIATEALGRGGNDDSEADTYARVAVARLRKALTSYYAAHPDQDEIYVDTETYVVRIRSRVVPPAEVVEAPPTSGKGPRRLLASIRGHEARYIFLGLALLVLAVSGRYYLDWQMRDRWLKSNFPTLALVYAESGNTGNPRELEADAFAHVMLPMLAESFGFRLIEAGSERADYEITLDVDRAGEGLVQTVTLVETASGRLVWTQQYPVSSEEDLHRSAQLAAGAIAAPDGAINDFGRRKGIDTNTPYGCWLQFTGSVMSYSPAADARLMACTEDWYAADKASRTAAFLRNWTMVDASLTMLLESRRRSELEAALTVAHEALARNPDNAMLYIGEMRTYSFLGMSDEVRHSARSAIEAAPNNRVVLGMAATWLTFWNDPMGADILAELEAGPNGGLPWEHAGRFVAAMMNDDVETAGRHLADLRFYMEGQPALNLLEAAYFRRVGRHLAAEAALDKIRDNPRGWIAGPDEIMRRLPIAPEVKARLEQWLVYGTTPAEGGIS